MYGCYGNPRKAKIMRKLSRLQLYTSIVSSFLTFIVYMVAGWVFTEMDVLEMIAVYVCFILPLVAVIPFYITED